MYPVAYQVEPQVIDSLVAEIWHPRHCRSLLTAARHGHLAEPVVLIFEMHRELMIMLDRCAGNDHDGLKKSVCIFVDM